MPYASTYIKNALLKFAVEIPQGAGMGRSRWGWVIPDFDREIGANKVWRNLKVSWMMNKRDFFALVHSFWDVKRGGVSGINKSEAILRDNRTDN
ncbi:MAG: hypothetical protein HGB15_02780 [Chlorobaculum sp.]|nr:hypothetical protein [Chlorobaculum sp.]